MGTVEVAALAVDLDPLGDRVQVGVELRPVEALEAVLACPFVAHPVVGSQAVRPVDHRAAADARSGDHRDLAFGGRKRAAVEVEALVGGELQLVEAPAGIHGIRGVAKALFYALPDLGTGRNPNWDAIGYPGPQGPPPDWSQKACTIRSRVCWGVPGAIPFSASESSSARRPSTCSSGNSA
jgi:hypothetical protein